MSDEQDRAEALDADELGDNPFSSDEMPGEDFPPDHLTGARTGAFAPDGSVVVDDVVEREARLDRGRPDDVDGGVDLLSENELDEFDEEAELIGEAGEDLPSGEIPAEVAAMHVISERDATEGIYDEGI